MDTRENAPLFAAGGGLLLFVSLFFDWIGPASFWQPYDIVDILIAIIALLAVAAGGSIATGNKLNIPGGPGTVYTAGLIAFSIVAFHVLEGEERKIGMFLGLIGAIGIVVGGLGLSRAESAPRSGAETTSAPPPPPPPPTASA